MHSPHPHIPTPPQAAPPPSGSDSAEKVAEQIVGRALNRLSDEDREEAIKRAGQAVIRHMADWERTGCFAARGDADRARRLMELLIAGRSAQQVQRMRSAQAKRLACEPGAERG